VALAFHVQDLRCFPTAALPTHTPPVAYHMAPTARLRKDAPEKRKKKADATCPHRYYLPPTAYRLTTCYSYLPPACLGGLVNSWLARSIHTRAPRVAGTLLHAHGGLRAILVGAGIIAYGARVSSRRARGTTAPQAEHTYVTVAAACNHCFSTALAFFHLRPARQRGGR